MNEWMDGYMSDWQMAGEAEGWLEEQEDKKVGW